MRVALALVSVAALAAVAAVLPAGGATGTQRRTSDTLQLNVVFHHTGVKPTVQCPPGSSALAECFQFQGTATIPGLGSVTDRHIVLTDESNPSCATVLVSFGPDVLTVAGKGEIDSSIPVSAPCDGIPTGFVVTGGSGTYAGAAGSGTLTPNLVSGGSWQEAGIDDTFVDDDDMTDWNQDSWAGTLTVPNLTFDTTPPLISGAVSKTVKVRKGVKRVRVAFKVTAQDAVDGPLPATCRPRSGSLFKLGKTKVTCSATDSSANTATARFTVMVKPAR